MDLALLRSNYRPTYANLLGNNDIERQDTKVKKYKGNEWLFELWVKCSLYFSYFTKYK
jgi:hypothetical protein